MLQGNSLKVDGCSAGQENICFHRDDILKEGVAFIFHPQDEDYMFAWNSSNYLQSCTVSQ
jgi:hypothetical protein